MSIKKKYSTVRGLFERHAAGESPAGFNVSLAGWVRTVRQSKEVGFLELNDGSCQKNIQVVFGQEILDCPPANGSAVEVRGTVAVSENPNAKAPLEVNAESVTILGSADADYPISKKRHGFEYLRTVAHLRGRTNTFSAVFRLRSVLTFAIHEYLQKNGFVCVAAPCITSNDGEGAGEVVRATTLDLRNVPKNPDGSVDFTKELLGGGRFLTVTGQLNVEPFCAVFRDVYTFGPCFRAENSNTARHAVEFWQVEPEMAFADLEDVMDCIEGLTKHMIMSALKYGADELAFFDAQIEPGLVRKLENTVNEPYARVTYADALDILKKSGEKFIMPVRWGGFQTEWEKYLAEKAFGRPVFVTDYPREEKAFYMRQNDDGATVSAADLMFPGIGEVVGASAREERLDRLLARMGETGLRPEDYWWYLDLRRYGTFPHGGFGLGVERMMMFVTGMGNIRDVIPYPRTPGHAEF
ncbi:MAG: asparagine--tRNA ligase [Firmicutes bacterium]|nr:asparagine--tRNA ligase [Bacillota bacterium]